MSGSSVFFLSAGIGDSGSESRAPQVRSVDLLIATFAKGLVVAYATDDGRMLASNLFGPVEERGTPLDLADPNAAATYVRGYAARYYAPVPPPLPAAAELLDVWVEVEG